MKAIIATLIIGWIYIPAIALARPIVEAPIVDGVYDMSSAGYSVAHLAETDWLDGSSRIGLGAHNPGIVDSEGVYHSGSFGNIELLSEGDIIVIISGDTEVKFVVYDIRIVHVSEWQVLATTDSSMLTLIACYEPDDTYRIVVDAYRLGD
jgi:LPXTG-site transpeptidase (sortase) family protein